MRRGQDGGRSQCAVCIPLGRKDSFVTPYSPDALAETRPRRRRPRSLRWVPLAGFIFMTTPSAEIYELPGRCINFPLGSRRFLRDRAVLRKFVRLTFFCPPLPAPSARPSVVVEDFPFYFSRIYLSDDFEYGRARCHVGSGKSPK